MKQRKENVSRILEDEGKCMADKTKVFSKRDKNVDYMNQMLPVEDSFDIVQRDIQIGGKDATFYFIDGFTKDESMLKIMDSFFNIKEGDMPKDAAAFATTCIPYVEVDVIGDFDQIFRNLLNYDLQDDPSLCCKVAFLRIGPPRGCAAVVPPRAPSFRKPLRGR